MRFEVLVPFERDAHKIKSQVTFPPLFPLVPPIFAVINQNEMAFQVDSFYRPFLLPDGAYETRLQSSQNWGVMFNFEELFQDFNQVLAARFPFIPASNPIRNLHFPLYYPCIYSPEIKSAKPSSESFHESNLSNSNRSKSVLLKTTGSKNVPLRENRKLGQNNDFKNETSSNSSFYEMSKLLKELIEETNRIYEHLIFLIGKKEELPKIEREIREKNELLEIQLMILKQEEIKVKQLSEKEHKIQNGEIDNWVSFEKDEDEKILKLVSELKGLRETEAFLENCFMESPDINLENYLAIIGVMYRKEFDRLLVFKQILG